MGDYRVHKNLSASRGGSTPFWPRRSPNFLQVRTALRAAIQRQRQDRAQFIIAVSGGPDSLALAAAAAAERLDAYVVSIDHGLQEGSREVSERAIAQVRQWGLNGQVVPVTVAQDSANDSVKESAENAAEQSLEAAARHARYQALGEIAGDRPILLAHTGDDQAETLLLGLLRGKASAMREISDYQGRTLLRPLLPIRRAHTVGACTELEVEAWNDPHNADVAFRRVAIRRRVLPLLDEIVGGDASAPLIRAAELIREDDDYLQSLAKMPSGFAAGRGREETPTKQKISTTETTPEPTPEPPSLEITALGPRPLARRAIAEFLHRHGAQVTARTLAASIALIDDWHGQGAVSVGNRLELARQAGKLVLLHS
ncbi:tRNA lysidine(34) synthetase TilS [Corynebacterium sp. MSK297]|uniref:tRNA lysidine(34) synthetase TilS n=1 Tax=Corynebacterium sp. MSK297 TaxID=3050221 RepID=UPI00254E8161|nr:tRNA lysidine(34) synthetase TilS [Corynebacterium sp. MSK297]MDK8845734.1 tRNA lysidine(34) synthetase TilS [Corynebacterium sp. MSK297]